MAGLERVPVHHSQWDNANRAARQDLTFLAGLQAADSSGTAFDLDVAADTVNPAKAKAPPPQPKAADAIDTTLTAAWKFRADEVTASMAGRLTGSESAGTTTEGHEACVARLRGHDGHLVPAGADLAGASEPRCLAGSLRSFHASILLRLGDIPPGSGAAIQLRQACG